MKFRLAFLCCITLFGLACKKGDEHKEISNYHQGYGKCRIVNVTSSMDTTFSRSDSISLLYDSEGRLSKVVASYGSSFGTPSSTMFIYGSSVIYAAHFNENSALVSIDTVKLDADSRIVGINATACIYDGSGQLRMQANNIGDTTFYQWTDGDMIKDSSVSTFGRTLGDTHYTYSQEPAQWVNLASFYSYLAYGVPLFRCRHMASGCTSSLTFANSEQFSYTYDANHKVIAAVDSNFGPYALPTFIKYQYACD